MQDADRARIGLKVGLEIHQQLATGRKLFCGCSQREAKKYKKKFSRRMRITRGEMGRYDPAALFEKGKSRTMVYHSAPESSCLVEEDEEPPHELDAKAKNTALLIASCLSSRIFGEIFPMRKMVIDGSNTSGFQRTMLVSQGGTLRAGGLEVGVQSVCLEEDAARLIGDRGEFREYGLDRLGVPLVEITLDPIEATPKKIRQVALDLGRMLRATKKVGRGLGSIRQDVNVSVAGGGVVEVKGVQQLDQLEKVIEFEAARQEGLMMIAKKLEGTGKVEKKIRDITESMRGCSSEIIRRSVKNGDIVCAMLFPNFAGMFGYSPFEGVRLGAEIAQLVRFYGIGGVFHSDELPNYGIGEADVRTIRGEIGAGDGDGFLVMALPKSRYDTVPDQIIDRIRQAQKGVGSETRLARQDGRTVFLRPRPGPSRMYPETDVPPITVSQAEMESARQNIPKPWDEMIAELGARYGLNAQLAEQIMDSGYQEVFEAACADGKIPANFAASALCSTITSLQRKGLDEKLLTGEMILRCFELLAKEKITKESLETIFEGVMDGSADSVDEAVQSMAAGPVSDGELSRILDGIIGDNQDMVTQQGEHAIGMLMGIAMRELRGRAPGEKISKMLAAKIQESNKK